MNSPAERGPSGTGHDTASDCAKCRASDIHTAYHAARRDCLYASRAKHNGEHLHYTCRNCGYDWTVEVADA